jgi:hypothetical protein
MILFVILGGNLIFTLDARAVPKQLLDFRPWQKATSRTHELDN